MCRCNTNAFTHRRSYAETLYTQTFWHTDVFTHTHTRARSYTQTLLHPNAFTHGRFYTQRHLHRGSVTHRNAQRTFTHGRLLRTYALTQQNLHKVLPGTTSYYCVRREEGARGGQKRGEGGLVLLVPQSLHGILLCTTKFAEKCQYYPVLLCIAKFGQITSSTTYYFSISKFAESISQYYTSYYKACAGSEKGREWAGSNQYHFVLQSLHEVILSSTYYKVFNILTIFVPRNLLNILQSLHKVLPSAKLARNTSQYYFVLESLHKGKKYFPVLLRATNLAESTSQYFFVLHN